jgi:hypothetical protein
VCYMVATAFSGTPSLSRCTASRQHPKEFLCDVGLWRWEKGPSRQVWRRRVDQHHMCTQPWELTVSRLGAG